MKSKEKGKKKKETTKIRRYRDQVGGCQGRGMGVVSEMGEGRQKVQTFILK